MGHSSLVSVRIMPTSRITEASLGKIPTTRARRLISLLSRLRGWWTKSCASVLGGAGEGQDLGLGLIHVGPDPGDPGGELVSDLFPAGGHGLGVGLGEDGAEQRGDHVHLVLGHHGEQVAGEVDPAALMRGALEAAADRGHETGVLITDDESDSAG